MTDGMPAKKYVIALSAEERASLEKVSASNRRSVREKTRARKRRRVASTLRVKPEGPVAINQMWTMDFMHDTLNGGRRFRTLNIVDCWSREALAVEVDTR